MELPYIDNSNLGSTLLNRGGLHLYQKGSSTLAKNIKQLLDEVEQNIVICQYLVAMCFVYNCMSQSYIVVPIL